MTDETIPQRERRLIAEAEARARQTAKLEAHLQAHDRQFELLAGSVTKVVADVGALDGKVDALTAEVSRSTTVAETRASDAEKAAARQVTSRELYITAAGVTAAITTALAASGAFG